jgi:N-acetylglucosamine-6-sulfatase
MWTRILEWRPRKPALFSRRKLLGGVAGAALASQVPPARAQRAARPNVILIVADDLRADELWAMPAVSSRLVAEGTSFQQCLTPTPGCAPARASLLRGQYPQNHGVFRGNGDLGGFRRFREQGNEASTLATWLQDAGYRTALIGKYLNDYPNGASPNHIPPGWDEWAGATKGGYVGFELNENGTRTRYRRRDGAYQTDILAEKAADFIDRAAGQPSPFFLYIGSRAPHGPATAAPRHAGMFDDEQLPRSPAFNEAGQAGKPRWLQGNASISEPEIASLQETYRARLTSLQALDELVATVVHALDDAEVLQDTVILFTSDHGYHLGEHGIVEGKGTPYEEAIRIPLVIRGPGVPVGASHEVVSLIDIAPTIAAWANAEVPAFVDGRSITPVLAGETPPWRQAVLVTHHHNRATRTDGPPAFKAMRTGSMTYVEYADGWRELYDLQADPHQLDNLINDLDTRPGATLAASLAALTRCSGATCRSAEDDALPVA